MASDMRRLLVLSLLAVSLGGCVGSATQATPTATPTPFRGASVIGTVPLPTPSRSAKTRPLSTARPGTKPASLPPTVVVNVPTPTPIPARDFTAVIYGTVSDARTHRPLPGAIVQLSLQRYAATTNRAGRYRLKFPANAMIAVTVRAKGYAGQLSMGRVSSHKYARVNFQLTRVVPGKPVAPPPPSLFGTH